MRDLKFRMVTQTTGKFLGYVDIYDLLRNGSDVLLDFCIAALEGVKFEQYTGLKDKNGKEVYEGDIVKIWSNELSELALGGDRYYLDRFPYTREVKIDSRGVYIEVPGYMLLRKFADFEVIGNIHENPELLKGDE